MRDGGPNGGRETLRRSLDGVQRWVEARDYRGYDPGDGLTSFLRPLTFGSVLGERVLQQLVWKAPLNIRPLVGVRPMESTKGRGFMAWGYTLRYAATGDAAYRALADAALDWLDAHAEPGHAGHCWGNHFDFTTRSGRIRAHTPTIVWSGLIGQAFLEAFEQTGRDRYLEVAESICRWVLSLPTEKTDTGVCISYVPDRQSSIHNSNLLGAGLLARVWRHAPKEEYRAAAQAAVRYSCTRQRPDGAWWYGEAPAMRWIDNFHTAYNLDSLKRYVDCTGDDTFRPHLLRGYDYFKAVFFEPDGCPRYYHDRTYPIDIQCAAQAVDTFCHFTDEDREALSLAERVAGWTVGKMKDPSGYFYYRRYPLMTAKTPYFHWGQATMFKALAHLTYRLSAGEGAAAE